MIKYNRTWVSSVGNSNSDLNKYSINFGSSEANPYTLSPLPNTINILFIHASMNQPPLMNQPLFIRLVPQSAVSSMIQSKMT